MISLAPRRREGTVWGRHAPAAPPPQEVPSPTYCWRVELKLLNGDSLNPVTGLATTLAAPIVSGHLLVVIEICQLYAAGLAAHADIAPIYNNRYYQWVKYRLGVQVGFKLISGDKLKVEGDGGPEGNGHNLKAWTESPDWLKTRTLKFRVEEVACVPRRGSPLQYIGKFPTTVATVKGF